MICYYKTFQAFCQVVSGQHTMVKDSIYSLSVNRQLLNGTFHMYHGSFFSVFNSFFSSRHIYSLITTFMLTVYIHCLHSLSAPHFQYSFHNSLTHPESF